MFSLLLELPSEIGQLFRARERGRRATRRSGIGVGQLLFEAVPPVHGPDLVVAVQPKLRIQPLQAGKIVQELDRPSVGEGRDWGTLHSFERRHIVLWRLYGNLIVHSVLRIEPLIWRHLTT